MGVHGVKKLLAKYAPASLRPARPLDEFYRARFVIDAAGMMHRYKHAIFNPEEPYAYLHNILKQYEILSSYGIACIYVFDGKKPICKHREIQRRRELQQQQVEQFNDKVAVYEDTLVQFDQHTASGLTAEEAITRIQQETELPQALQLQLNNVKHADEIIKYMTQDIERHQKRVAHVTADDVGALQALFSYHSVPFMIATGEGEKTCAWMTRLGLADVVVADDTDTLAYGATRLLMNLMSSKHPPTEIVLDEVLNTLQLNLTQFVDMCILCGCDFAKIPGVAWGRAYDIIKKHGSIDVWMRQTRALASASSGRKRPRAKRATAAPVVIVPMTNSTPYPVRGVPTFLAQKRVDHHVTNQSSSEQEDTSHIVQMVHDARQEFHMDIGSDVLMDQRPFTCMIVP